MQTVQYQYVAFGAFLPEFFQRSKRVKTKTDIPCAVVSGDVMYRLFRDRRHHLPLQNNHEHEEE